MVSNMKDINIIDNFVDDREFRNYACSFLLDLGYSFVSIDDARLSDDDINNDNDFIVKKDDITYTVQVFLNISVSNFQVDETVDDIEREGVLKGIIVTNRLVDKEVKEYASSKSIIIYDKEILDKY